jgi:tetratricopeptide (TPR) repeat protein
MSGTHPDRLTILMYIEEAEGTDRESVARHLARCAVCREIKEELTQILHLLEDGDVVRYFAALNDNRGTFRTDVLTAYDRIRTDGHSADTAFAELSTRPMETWGAFFARHPEHRNGAMARRILKEVEVELNRRPEYALLLVGMAEEIAGMLADAESRAVLGDVWKQRSNAYRHLGQFDDALDAAEIAEAFYASLLTGAFDVAQAQLTRAVTLFKMTKYADAMQVLAIATETLRSFGDSVPLAKAIMLEAAIRIEQGGITAAQQLWRGVLPMLARLGDEVEQARVYANLAECNLRLGDYDAAMEDAQWAMDRYRVLHMEAESIRSAWTIGMIHLARGDFDAGLGEIENAAAAFESLGMMADAGFVKLDICEELLRRKEWTDAEVTARELAQLFTAAHATIASIRAIDYLRRAVENRQATAETVRYVRAYVTADDPARPFDPPPVVN